MRNRRLADWEAGPRGGSSCHLATTCPLASRLRRDIWIELASSFPSSGHIHMPKTIFLLEKTKPLFKWRGLGLDLFLH